MKYSPHYKAFLLSQSDLDAAATSFKAALYDMRKVAGVSLGKRKKPDQLEAIDHAEREILNAARFIGIDFGVKWGFQLDLSDWEEE